MDKNELLVIAFRAENDWLGIAPVNWTDQARQAAGDRIEAIVDAVLKACSDDLRHLGDIDHLNAWIGLYTAADRLEELR